MTVEPWMVLTAMVLAVAWGVMVVLLLALRSGKRDDEIIDREWPRRRDATERVIDEEARKRGL